MRSRSRRLANRLAAAAVLGASLSLSLSTGAALAQSSAPSSGAAPDSAPSSGAAPSSPTPAPSRAGVSTALFSPGLALESAERAYEEGMSMLRQNPAEARRRFEESASLYAQLRDSGADNAALHFNLGNAQLQAGRIGEAIASYLRAQRAAPGETRVQRNLAHARTLVPERFESAGATTLLENAASWWHVVSLRTRWWVAIGAWTLLWMLLLLRSIRPSITTGEGAAIAWRWSVGVAAVAVLVAGGTVAVDAAMEHWRPRGVIVEPGVVVRKGNGEGFEPQFQESLGEGVEFRVRDRRPGWVEIELPNGRGGWIREGDASLI